MTIQPEESQSQSTIALDIQQADANYWPFPSFSEWLNCKVDIIRWDRYATLYQEIQSVSDDILARARDEIKRCAAVETGAIEGLYDSHQGITFTAGVEITVWEAAINQMEEKERKLIQSQLAAYDYVLDFATGQQPIAEAWIRELHAVICKEQKTFKVLTAAGWQEQELPLGKYKTQSNHVRKKSTGEIYSYAPVDRTGEEMHRLCQELNSEAFQTAHPAIQAAYAHYAFVRIHPFSDGNGRVSRALASIFTYRSNSIPLLITNEQRNEYIAALEASDQNNYQPFVDFIFERTIDAIRVVNDSVKTAATSSPEENISKLLSLYRTKGNYTHDQVDEAGQKLMALLYESLTQKQGEINENSNGSIQLTLYQDSEAYTPAKTESRLSVKYGPRRIIGRLVSEAPADAQIVFSISLELPKDCGKDDEIILYHQQQSEFYDARISEILPNPTDTLKMRAALWAKKIMGKELLTLQELAANSLRRRGY